MFRGILAALSLTVMSAGIAFAADDSAYISLFDGTPQAAKKSEAPAKSEESIFLFLISVLIRKRRLNLPITIKKT